MTWVEITDRDICIEGVENKINCYASGTIYAGQGVTLTNTTNSSQTYVMPGNLGADKRALGIAAMDATSILAKKTKKYYSSEIRLIS